MRFCYFQPYILAIVMSLGLAQFAQAQACPEIKDFGDIEGLPVYEGSCLFGASDEGFSSFSLATGPMQGRDVNDSHPLEGTLQRRLYVAPAGASALDVFANYQNALADAGYETLFTCALSECGSRNALLGKLVIYPPERKLKNLGQASEFALYIDGEEHYLAAKSADGTRYIALYVAMNQNGAILKDAAGRAAIHLDVVTTAALEARMVDAAAMAKGISDDGHIAIENIYFDFGTANLTPEAAPAISEMAKFLNENENEKVKVFIVGHTDWVGDQAANLALSSARAQAVVAALVSAGITADRVTAQGVGMLAPRASNATDAGRALNRRVEMVER